MDAESLVQHIERDMEEATLFPPSVTGDWLEDDNETTVNQFQQPDWQVRDHSLDQDQKLDWSRARASSLRLGGKQKERKKEPQCHFFSSILNFCNKTKQQHNYVFSTAKCFPLEVEMVFKILENVKKINK